MPLYPYRCAIGHVTDEFRAVSDRDRPTVCACGRKASRHIALPQDSRLLGNFDTPDDTAAYGGVEHVTAMEMQREHAEWMTAIGAGDGAHRLGDGNPGKGRSRWAHPTPEGIAKKKDLVKRGVKPPESVTFGLKREFVESIGK